jgi:hypothetical protein
MNGKPFNVEYDSFFHDKSIGSFFKKDHHTKNIRLQGELSFGQLDNANTTPQM